jgi:hypothetical protein
LASGSRVKCSVHNNNPAVTSQQLISLLVQCGFSASDLIAA